MNKNFEKQLKQIAGKKIVVTGSSGYIGSEVIKLFEANNIIVKGIDKLPPDNKNCICMDLCSREDVTRLIDEFGPDYIFHFGTHSALAYRDQFKESYKEDSMALLNILDAVQDRPIRLVFFSSSYVYSGFEGQGPVSEETVFKSEHPFGIAKSFFEQLIRRTHPESVVFRLASVFGPGKALHPNAVYNMALECRQNGRLTVWGSGLRMMQYVYIPDVLSFILEGCLIPAGIYNLGGEQYISVAQSADLIARFMKSDVEYLKDKQEGMTLPFMDNSKLKAASNDTGFESFENALEEYLNSIKWD